MTMSYAPSDAEQYNGAHLLKQPLLTADEAAELLHVPRSTVYELVRSRGLPHVRIGERGLRFTRVGLERWVDSHTYGRP
jgi:excisionase family DNA binding protein